MKLTSALNKNIKWVFVFLIICLIVYLIHLINKPRLYKKQNTSLSNPTIKKIMEEEEERGKEKGDKEKKCNTDFPRINNMDMDMSKDIDRQYLVDEDPELIPANEVDKRNYKGWMNEEGKCKGEMNEELYTDDVPLFDLKGPINLVPLDLNSDHRRVNFY